MITTKNLVSQPWCWISVLCFQNLLIDSGDGCLRNCLGNVEPTKSKQLFTHLKFILLGHVHFFERWNPEINKYEGRKWWSAECIMWIVLVLVGAAHKHNWSKQISTTMNGCLAKQALELWSMFSPDHEHIWCRNAFGLKSIQPNSILWTYYPITQIQLHLSVRDQECSRCWREMQHHFQICE